LTDTHVKLDILVDTQEPLSDNHHTMIQVEELTLTTSEEFLSGNSNSSAKNASTAFEYKCYEVEADAP
jgi:hypothetical protein